MNNKIIVQSNIEVSKNVKKQLEEKIKILDKALNEKCKIRELI